MQRQRLIDILRASGFFMEGDFSSGRDTLDEQARKEARKELSAMTVGRLNVAILVEDEVSEVLASHLDKKLALQIAHLTLGEVKDILLGNNGSRFANEYRDGMSSVLISALVKIMTNEELSAVSLKIFNSLPGTGGNVAIGSRNHLGSRAQTNSAGDNEEEILLLALEALSYGCGDVMFGYNPACDDVPTVMRLVDFFAGFVQRLGLPTRTCVLSDIVKLSRARELGAKVDLGFQSLAGTSKALKGMVELDAKEILELARGFPGLYFEIGMGLEITNGSNEGVDMRTLTSRAAGVARYIGQVTGKWMVVNTVTNFIGPEVFRTEEQLFRAGMEDIVMLKLHGITGGIDVCAPFHMGIHPERLRAITEKLVEAAHPAFFMSIPGGIDEMLGYETTPSRAYPTLCAKNAFEMTSVMKERLLKLGVMGRCGLPIASSEVILNLYAEYQKAGGDERELEGLRAEGKRKIAVLQSKNFDVGYGCPHKFVEPPLMKKRIEDIYDNAQKALVAKFDPAVLRDVSPKYLKISTLSFSRDDYINHPETGNTLSLLRTLFVRGCYWRFPQVQFVISDGLNANAINENLRSILPGVRRGLTDAGFNVGKTDIFITNGRVRAGYDIGRILEVPVIIHCIGERPGTGLNTLSAYITYGKNSRGNWRFHSDMSHSYTTAVCGIHKRGKHPDIAIEEIVKIVKFIFEKKCSGVELNAL